MVRFVELRVCPIYRLALNSFVDFATLGLIEYAFHLTGRIDSRELASARLKIGTNSLFQDDSANLLLPLILSPDRTSTTGTRLRPNAANANRVLAH